MEHQYLLKRGDKIQDAEIIRLFQERDEGSVSAAMGKYRGYCLKIALNILGGSGRGGRVCQPRFHEGVGYDPAA